MSTAATRPLVATRRDPPSRCRPGLRHGTAPERREPPRRHTPLDRLALRTAERLVGARERGRERTRTATLRARIAALAARSPDESATALARLRVALAARGHDEQSLVDGLAHASLAAERALGLAPHAGQLTAATALLQGRFVEMPTGEGKTLATALAAAVTALDGTPVHVLTANDYLAERDATRLAPLYAALGLRCACALPTMDERARRAAYAHDVVHLTGKQAGFDWLRDALAGGPEAGRLVARLGELTRPHAAIATRGGAAENAAPLLRGLCAAIVDEADSLLIDEARTPLVLAASHVGDEEIGREGSVALGLANMLREGIDFRLRRDAREVTLTEEGAATLARLTERVPGTWRATRYRDERVRQALVALHLWRRDRDYIVREGRVELVDEQSGRALPDRRLQRGLHGLLELKERCRVTPESDTVASIAFQRFFLRYTRLTGTSGTLHEVRGELARVYGVPLAVVPPEQPSRRVTLPPRVLASRAAQLDALIEEVRRALASDRPVLVGTRSVEQSSGVSALLTAHRVPHRVLNALQDGDEAAIVAEAGRAARVTVATNMAGRGTDIPLGDGVAERGGLHVVSLAFNDARRIDRQLAGRAARQGDPGSFRQLWSLDDPALGAALPGPAIAWARRRLDRAPRSRLAHAPALALVRLAQYRVERRHARQRAAALAASEHIARHTAIGGDPDHPA